MTDLEEAVRRFQEGDRSAFRAIVEATSARLLRLAARMLGSLSEAEDVVQESYVKAHRSLLEGEFDRRARVETWLYRIVVNASIDAKRKRKRTPQPASDDIVLDPGWDGAASAEARLALQELDDWLKDLPEEQRAVLVLKAVEGLGSAEIAEILGVTEGAVEQRLVRARATLREKRGAS